MATQLTWVNFFIDTPANDRIVKQWRLENAAFLATPEGRTYLEHIQEAKHRWAANEAWFKNNPTHGTEYNSQRSAIILRFQNNRNRIMQNPLNPTSPNYAAPAPAQVPTNAGAPPPTAAPPVYLPSVNAPQYMFPSAENVRDMTYDPGIGGFLRPNQWQPGVPSSPYMPGVPPSAPAPPPAQPYPSTQGGGGQTGTGYLPPYAGATGGNQFQPPGPGGYQPWSPGY